jgi:hypothetical protein
MTIQQMLARIHVATILILLLALVGAVCVLTHTISFDQYFKDITTGGGLRAIGRGLGAVTIKGN